MNLYRHAQFWSRAIIALNSQWPCILISTHSSKDKYLLPVIQSSLIFIMMRTATLRRDWSFGYAPDTRLLRFSSLLILSRPLVVRIRLQSGFSNVSCRHNNVQPNTPHPQYLHPGKVSPLPRYSTWLRLPYLKTVTPLHPRS